MLGDAAPLPAVWPAPAPAPATPEAPCAAPELEGWLAAACDSMAALFIIWLAVEMALARFGRDEPDDEDAPGASMATNGDEAAETRLAARLEPGDEAAPAGRVCT